MLGFVPHPNLRALGRHLAEWRIHAAGLRRAWLCILGAPDYQAYLAYQREHHPDTPPLSERDYVRWFIDRRYNKPGGGCRCCWAMLATIS